MVAHFKRSITNLVNSTATFTRFNITCRKHDLRAGDNKQSAHTQPPLIILWPCGECTVASIHGDASHFTKQIRRYLHCNCETENLLLAASRKMKSDKHNAIFPSWCRNKQGLHHAPVSWGPDLGCWTQTPLLPLKLDLAVLVALPE
jgi:hypothetical protein